MKRKNQRCLRSPLEFIRAEENTSRKTYNASTNCHQCKRNDKGPVQYCSKCPKRYCNKCIDKWYSLLTYEDIVQACPFCRKNNNLYLGLRQPRLEGDEYLSVLDEFMEAVFTRWPKVIVQFEDFQTKWAFKLLQRYRKSFRMFNDDVQGTAGVALDWAIRCS